MRHRLTMFRPMSSEYFAAGIKLLIINGSHLAAEYL